MLKYVSGRDIKYTTLAEEVWRFRHRHFVERFRWEDLRRADNREIDEFDRDDAIHLILSDGDRVVAYSRLLPTLAPHLLSDVYPQLADGFAYPKGRRIYEWTRCVAEQDAMVAGLEASVVLRTGVLEFCLSTGIHSLIVETHPKLVQLLLSTGWDVTPFAPPMELSGSLVVPIQAVASLDALRKHHELYGINGSVLDFHPDAINPITGRAFDLVIEHRHGEAVRGKHHAA